MVVRRELHRPGHRSAGLRSTARAIARRFLGYTVLAARRGPMAVRSHRLVAALLAVALLVSRLLMLGVVWLVWLVLLLLMVALLVVLLLVVLLLRLLAVVLLLVTQLLRLLAKLLVAKVIARLRCAGEIHHGACRACCGLSAASRLRNHACR